MKIKKVSIIICATMFAMIHTSALMAMKSMVDTTARAEEEKIEAAIAQAKTVIEAAQDRINAIHKQQLLGFITKSQATQLIKAQEDNIAGAEKTLGKILKKSISVVESSAEEEGYFNSLVAQAKEMGSQAVSLAKSGQVFTEKQKRLARREIKRLREQQEILLKEYEDKIAFTRNTKARKILEKRYQSMMAKIDGKIHEKQIITGEAMSSDMQKFWSVIGTGALIAGAYFAGTGSEVVTVSPMPEQELKKITKIPDDSAQQREAKIDKKIEDLRRQAGVRVEGEQSGYTRAMQEMVEKKTNKKEDLAQLQPPAPTPILKPVPEKKVLTQEEREAIKKSAKANFLWAAIAGLNAFVTADLAAFAASPLMVILNPSVGFAGIAAATGAAGLNKIIQLMSEN